MLQVLLQHPYCLLIQHGHGYIKFQFYPIKSKSFVDNLMTLYNRLNIQFLMYSKRHYRLNIP